MLKLIKKHRLAKSLSLIVLFIIISAQTISAGSKYVFNNLSIADGLAHTDVRVISEDKDGFIWLGTNGGLQVYDGYDLITYDYYSDFPNIIRKLDNRITALCEIGEYYIVGTNSGINIFYKTERKYIETNIIDPTGITKIKDNVIYNLKKDSKDNIWVQTEEGFEVMSLSPNGSDLKLISTFSYKNFAISRTDIVTIGCHGKGIYIILKNAKALYLEANGEEIIPMGSYSLPILNEFDKYVMGACLEENNIYLKYRSGIIAVEIDSKSGKINSNLYNKLIISDKYRSEFSRGDFIILDHNNNLWCECNNGILKISYPWSNKPIYQEITGTKLTDSRYDIFEAISAIFIDSQSNIWVASWGNGVACSFVTGRQFLDIPHLNENDLGISGTYIKDVEKDKDGYLWILSQDFGLEKYDFKTEQVKEYYTYENLHYPYILKTIKHSADEKYIYAGSATSLLAIEKSTKKVTKLIATYGAEILNESVNIYDICIDNNDNIWCGTWNKGIIVLKKEGKRHSIIARYNTDTGLSSNVISEIIYRNNEIWAATNNGINRLFIDKNANIKNTILYSASENKKDGLNCGFISGMAFESDSLIWVSTIGGGVNRISLEKNGNYSAIAITEADGLPNNDIEMIKIDEENNLWVGSTTISKIYNSTLEVKNYANSEGIANNVFKIGSSYQDNNGIIFFGGVNGMSFFNPMHIHDAVSYSGVIFSRVDILETYPNKKQSSGYKSKYIKNNGILKLRPDENRFSIHFSSLNYFDLMSTVYRYKMKGLNNDWIMLPVGDNSITFIGLNYGNYELIVQSSYNNGANWNEIDTASMKIKLVSPWWLSSIAKVIYLLLFIVLVIILFIRYRQEVEIRHKLEIKELEEKKVEDNHQLKLQFFTNISHEFRTPLTIITSAIERLENIINEDQKELVESMSRNTKKLLTLISQLMDFRKTDINKDEIRAINGDISSSITEIITEFNIWAEKKNISLNYSKVQTGIRMWYDVEKVSKIVWNLVSNALKYTDVGGWVNISLYEDDYSEIRTTYSDSFREEANPNMGKAVVFKISDSGVGIVPESLPRLFNRYFQVVNKSSLHLGSGIGLALVKNMVITHNGNIIVSSKKDLGSEFIVAIAMDSSYIEDENRHNSAKFDIDSYLDQELIDIELTPSIKVPTIETIDKEKETMLIVEDNVELISMLYSHFSEKYNVITALNGKEGLQKALEIQPDIIISDVMMPLMNGVDMCSEIKENLSTMNIPIIILSAKGEEGDQIEGMTAGADIYIPKPFTTKILDLHVTKLIAYKEKLDCINNNNNNNNIDMEGESSEPSKVEENTTITNIRTHIFEQKDKEFIEELQNLILNNLDNSSYTVASLCSDLGIGRTRLYSKIKSITNQTLGEMIRDIRIKKAAELLLTTDSNITEVMYQVGISSNSHFSKSFKQYFGMTPSEYIKSNN